MKIHFPCLLNEYAKNIKNIDTVCLEGQDQLIIECVGDICDYPTYSTTQDIGNNLGMRFY